MRTLRDGYDEPDTHLNPSAVPISPFDTSWRKTVKLSMLIAACFFLALSCKKDPVQPPPDGLDTTSHNWTFTTEVIGEFGSYLRDVALLDDGTAWAVGRLSLRDSNGQIDPTVYNLMRWNGTSWSAVRVMFPVCDNNGNEIGTAPFQCNALFVFGANDVWLTSGGNFVHWNGSVFQRYCLPPDLIQGEIMRMWGTSTTRFFAVGRNGTIIMRNGTTWQRFESNTTVDLLDVWGSPDGSVVWACGYRPDYSESILIKYDGTTWQTVWKTPPPVSTQPYDGLLQTLWSAGTDSLYVVGGEGVWRQHPAGGTARKDVLPLGSFPLRVRGSAGNDLFIAGFDGMVWHFSGNTWRRFHHLTNSLHVYNAIALRGNTVMAVGADYSATIQRGLVLVGTRPVSRVSWRREVDHGITVHF